MLFFFFWIIWFNFLFLNYKFCFVTFYIVRGFSLLHFLVISNAKQEFYMIWPNCLFLLVNAFDGYMFAYEVLQFTLNLM